MPIKKDGTGKRWVEIAFLTPGTPEQVWHAMATGPGYAAWFTKAFIEERVGGELRFEFGPEVVTRGEVTKWEPSHQFGYVEREWSEGAPPIATEITIAGRAGGQCVVRMVHSLFASTDDWDDQMEGFEHGWGAILEVLRLYLSHFAGMKGASFMASHAHEGDDSLSVWKRMIEALGLVAANVGEERTANGPERLSGVIENVKQDQKQRYITMRLRAPVPGVAILGTHSAGKSVNASMSLVLYGDDAEERAEKSRSAWTEWLGKALSSPPA